MHIPTVFAFLVLQCTLCHSIRVPVDWNNESEVNKNGQSVNIVKNDERQQRPVQNEYFQYTAKRPQFVIDVAEDHGAQFPKENYKSYPIIPYTGLPKPLLGQHLIQNPLKTINPPNEGFINHSGGLNYARPASTSFEVYHPYKAEEPALQGIYKDPVLEHIRNDLRDVSHKTQKYQLAAGESDIRKHQHLETPEQTDRRKLPQKNIPTEFEVHRPERRPVYYRYPQKNNYRGQILNEKLRHPWNHNIAKVTPIHYHPLKKHLHGLRQNHALKYDDELNEYPQLIQHENTEEQPDGYDIYEKGKEKFVQLNNYFDNALNKTQHNSYDEKLESLKQKTNNTANHGETEEGEFVPIKNYAQVRKTEITKHVPKETAFHDAETLEEIENAPRLREAIKSKKAQIVYSEEGYEDSAYDHAGEQKHASDHENHGGYLKENEISEGKFKIPSVKNNYEDAKGVEHRNHILHGNKWENDIKENEDESESDYYESEEDDSDADVSKDESNGSNEKDRDKWNSHEELNHNNTQNSLENKDFSQHDINKRETSVKRISKDENTDIKIKYPYYYKNLKVLSKNSPLRYAENYKMIPKKTNGGSEFYDSRSQLECPEVEDNVDPIPEKLKKDGHPDDDTNEEKPSNKKKKRDKEFDKNLANKQRLHGLGDKIDCFKAKYFGENPLDNPFFQEELIENPEPVTKPYLEVFNTKQQNNEDTTKYSSETNLALEQNGNKKLAVPVSKDNLIQNSLHSNKTLIVPHSKTNNEGLILIKDQPQNASESNKNRTTPNLTSAYISNTSQLHKIEKSIPPLPIHHLKKRATPFMYEPYKILRDSQNQDSKKTTTSSNISPLIKQLQSSRVIDKVTNQDKEQVNKNKSNLKVYKDIGKVDRQGNINTNSNISDSSFVDVSTDTRHVEPRYEIRPTNNNSQLSSVAHKRSTFVEDDNGQAVKNLEEQNTKTKSTEITRHSQLKRIKRLKSTARPFFDVSKYLPQTLDTQNIAASNVVRKVMKKTEPETSMDEIQTSTSSVNYNDNDDDDDIDSSEEIISTTATAITTVKPTIKWRIKLTTSTTRPVKTTEESGSSKLRLTTRFRDFQPNKKGDFYTVTEEPVKSQYIDHSSPRYTEKKRKSTKSTLVTDTKSYGDEGNEDDDLNKDEVDRYIGVKQDMDEYIPLYERVVNKINRMKHDEKNNRREHKYGSDFKTHSDDDPYGVGENDDDDDDDDDEEDDDDDYENENNDDEDENNEDERDKKGTNKNEEKNEDDNTKDNSHNDDRKKQITSVTTSEPTKRTLARTTEAPSSTTETRNAKLELKPIVLKKKIEIHKELPVDRSSSNMTQFKHDVEEIEVIKEMPVKSRKKTNKNLEALDLFRDDKLAEEINKLGDVEVFKENLDLKSAPRHGGNYRSITQEELDREKILDQNDGTKKDDVEASQTQTLSQIKENPTRRRSRYHAQKNPEMKSSEINAKFPELSDTIDTKPKSMHGGNLKLPRNRNQGHKSEKYVEIDESNKERPSDMHGGNFKSYGNSRNSGRQMHGGNYRSAKLIKADDSKSLQDEENTDTTTKTTITTTTPFFILDPSKRMYYYVDA